MDGEGSATDATGLTGIQRFFLALAQAWCTSRRPELARTLAAVDPHSPPQFRVNGPLGNLAAFAAALACQDGTAMVRAKPCSVW